VAGSTATDLGSWWWRQPPNSLRLKVSRRLEHEYSLAPELDPVRAAKPLALTRHEGRTILVLTDPGGEPLDRVLERPENAFVGGSIPSLATTK